MTKPAQWYRPDQSVPGRSNTMTDKIAASKVYLHREFYPCGDLKAIHISQPQKFRDTQVEAILEGIEELVNASLETDRQRRAQ